MTSQDKQAQEAEQIAFAAVNEPTTLLRHWFRKGYSAALSQGKRQAEPVALSTLTDDDIDAVFARCFDGFVTLADQRKAAREILALAASAPALQAGGEPEGLGEWIDSLTNAFNASKEHPLNVDDARALVKAVLRRHNQLSALFTPSQPVAAEQPDQSGQDMSPRAELVKRALFDIARREGLALTWTDRLRLGQAVGMLGNPNQPQPNPTPNCAGGAEAAQPPHSADVLLGISRRFSRDSFDARAFFAAVERAMVARDINAKQLAAATGISESTLSRMRDGTRTCDAASLAALSAWAGLNPASYCGVTPEAAITSESATEVKGDASCANCGGTGEIFGHAENCTDDLCALNGDEHSCGGRVEPCGCTQVPAPDIPPACEMARGWAVEVSAQGARVLLLSDLGYSGLTDLDPWASTIRGCAEHLQAFIGPAGGSPALDPEPESLETSETEAREPHPCASGCRYALNGEGLAPQCFVGCRKAAKEGIKG